MGKRKAKAARLTDLYEAEEAEPEENKQSGQRYDVVDNFQYELPEDFEDEEIDEDTAFTEEDKQLYAAMLSSKKSKKGTTPEPQAEEAVEDGTELTRDDFSDDDTEADRIYGKPQQKFRQGSDIEQDADVDEIFAGLSDDEGSEDEQETENGSDEPSAAELAKLSRVVQESLGPSSTKRASRTELLDEAVPESQYNLTLGADTAGGELSVGDLMAGLGPDRRLIKAGRQLKELAQGGKPVAPPLPGPIRARKERQAGYEETKKDVAKWTPIVRANREAPTLVFTAPKNDVPRTTTTAALTAKFEPESSMEAEVAAMLKAAGIHNDNAVKEAEEALALKAVSADNMAHRREELAKMRSLLFKHEEKAKHLAKIKSKGFHRRMKKSARLKAERAGELDDQDFIRLEAEKAEFERAKERLTLKHKNTSQWARRALKRGVNLHEDGKKEAITEQLLLGQELRRKVDRVDPVRGSDTDASDAHTDASASGSEGDDDNDGSKLGKSATAKARAAATAILEGSVGEEDGMSKSLFALPFMKRAQEKRKMAAQEDARRLLEELDGATQRPEEPPQGRRNFGMQGGVQASNAAEGEVDSEASGSDAEEDAEAKLQRLREAAATDRRLSGQAATTSSPGDPTRQQPSRKHKKAKPAAADIADSEEEGTGGENWGFSRTTVISKGPILVDGAAALASPACEADKEPGKAASKAGSGVLERVTKAQSTLAGRAHVLSSASGVDLGRNAETVMPQKGKSTIAVSIRPASGNPSPQQGGKAVIGEQLPSFVQANGFSGQKAGYAFSRGDDGVGYYLDSTSEQSAGGPMASSAHQSQQAADEAADTIIAAAAAIGEDEVVEDGEPDMKPAGGLTQRELIAQAFAGDDVAAEFEAEKAAEAEKELPTIEAPSLLPGWGAWASQQREPKWMAAAKAKAARQKAAAKAGRRDAKLEAVAISERWDKKAAKFNGASLPYPFTSKEAFEGSMRQPLGADFNTQSSFREMTKPSIIKSSGVIIQPLKFSKQVAEDKKGINRTSNASRTAVSHVSGGMAQPVKKRK